MEQVKFNMANVYGNHEVIDAFLAAPGIAIHKKNGEGDINEEKNWKISSTVTGYSLFLNTFSTKSLAKEVTEKISQLYCWGKQQHATDIALDPDAISAYKQIKAQLIDDGLGNYTNWKT